MPEENKKPYGREKQSMENGEQQIPVSPPVADRRCEDMLLPNGNHIPEYYILEYPDWVNTIAITKEGKFVFGPANTVPASAGLVMNFVPVCVKRKTLRHWYPPNANYGKKPATEMATGRNIW